MICDPCKRAASALTRMRALNPDLDPVPHLPGICADALRTTAEIDLHGRGCTCAHGLTHHTPREDQHA